MAISIKKASFCTLAFLGVAAGASVLHHAHQQQQDAKLIKASKDQYLSDSESVMKSLFKDWDNSAKTKAVSFGYLVSERDLKFAQHDMFLAAHENKFEKCINYNVDAAWRRRVTKLELDDHASRMPNEKFVAVVVDKSGEPDSMYVFGTSCTPK